MANYWRGCLEKKKKKSKRTMSKPCSMARICMLDRKKTMLTLQVMVFLAGLLHKSHVVVVMFFVIWLLF